LREEEFRLLCKQRGLDDEQTNAAVLSVGEFEAFLGCRGQTLDCATVDALKAYITELVDTGENSPGRLLALARYSYLTGAYPLYVYLAGVIGGNGIVSSLASRTAQIAGEAARSTVFSDLAVPPVGSPQEQYPAVTQQIVERLRSHLPLETCKDILAGNHHKIPEDAFEECRRAYAEGGVDGLLRFRRGSLLSELEEHAKTGKPWYEQVITPKVVEFVRQNPEIQAGVRRGNAVFAAKIPYAPMKYLEETDPKMKRYYLCHCPLARASILDESPRVSPLFCYCSGGYEKLVFDVVFGEPVRVSVLTSALAGDLTCRFQIDMPEGCRMR
jgi:hypothetical protein